MIINMKQTSMNVEDDSDHDEDLVEPPPDGKFDEFCDETSMAGFRYLRSSHWIRKLIWALILIVAIVLLVYQIVKQVGTFNDTPISTSIELKYFDRLAMPAIAICNNNQYKISSAAVHGVYNVITEFFEDGKLNDFELSKAEAEHQFLNSRDFHERMITSLEDMIIKCTWSDHTACSAKDFVRIYTDFGLCYAINTDIKYPKYTSMAGLKGGIELVLNLEAFEAMAGPSDTQGLKVVIYNQTETPVVYGLSLDLPTGFHSYIGLERHGRHRVHIDEGGTCVDEHRGAEIQYFSTKGINMYTVDTCYQNEHWKNIRGRCGCDAYNSPATCDIGALVDHCKSARALNLCSTEQHFLCAGREIPATTNLTKVDDEDVCRQNCKAIAFKSILSMSRLPSSAVENLISEERKQNIASSYEASLEARYKVQQSKRETVEKNVGDLLKVIEQFEVKQLAPLMNNFKGSWQRLMELPCFNGIATSPAKDELSGVYAANVDLIPVSATTVLRVLVESKMNKTMLLASYKYLLENPDYATGVATQSYYFQSVITVFKKGLSYFTERFFAVELTEDYEPYVKLRAAENGFNDGNLALRELAMEMESLGANFMPLFQTDFVDKLGMRAYDDFTWMNTFLGTSSINSYVVELVTQVMMDPNFVPLFAAQTMNERFANVEESACQQALISQCLGPVGDTNETMTQKTERAINQCSAIFGINSPKILAELICPIEDMQNNPIVFIGQIFNCMMSETGLGPLAYVFDRDTRALSANLSEPFAALLDFSRKFVISSRMNDEFYKDNMLAVNIFYKELMEEHYIQQKSYDIWMLACDVGGAMCLFLGASIMVIGEMIDFFCLRPMMGDTHGRKRKKVDIDEAQEFNMKSFHKK